MNMKRSKRSLFFLWAGAGIFFLAPLIFAADKAEQGGVSADALLEKRLVKIESQVKKVSENMESINNKNKEIQTELQNLQVWINRRR